MRECTDSAAARLLRSSHHLLLMFKRHARAHQVVFLAQSTVIVMNKGLALLGLRNHAIARIHALGILAHCCSVHDLLTTFDSSLAFKRVILAVEFTQDTDSEWLFTWIVAVRENRRILFSQDRHLARCLASIQFISIMS